MTGPSMRVTGCVTGIHGTLGWMCKGPLRGPPSGLHNWRSQVLAIPGGGRDRWLTQKGDPVEFTPVPSSTNPAAGGADR